VLVDASQSFLLANFAAVHKIRAVKTARDSMGMLVYIPPPGHSLTFARLLNVKQERGGMADTDGFSPSGRLAGRRNEW